MWPGSFVMNLALHPVGSSSNVLGWTIRFAAVVSSFLANRLLFRKAKESDWRRWHFGVVNPSLRAYFAMLNALSLIAILLLLAWTIRELRKSPPQQTLPQQPDQQAADVIKQQRADALVIGHERVVRPVTPPATNVQVVDSPSLRLAEFCRAQRRAEAEKLSLYGKAGSLRPARVRRTGPAASGGQDPRWAEYEKLCPYDKAPRPPIGRVRRSGRAVSGGLPSLGKRRR